MSFLRRELTVTLKLKQGFFKEAEADSVTLSGHRVSLVINSPGGQSTGNAHCVIYGMSKSLMNQLTAIGAVNNQNIGNQISVEAITIDSEGKRSQNTAYSGTIQASWADFTNQPDVMLQVVSTGGLLLDIKPVSPTSFDGNTSVVDVASELAKEGGLTLINHGVSGQLNDPYYEGSTLTKIRKLSLAANIKFDIDEVNNTLSIYPQDGLIDGDVPTISPSTGLVGYPAFSQNGIIVKSLYNPVIRNNTRIKLESSLEQANGEFGAFDVTHTLESYNPHGGGAWFTEFRAFRAP